MLSSNILIAFFFIVFISLLRTCFFPLISKIFALITLSMVIIAAPPEKFLHMGQHSLMKFLICVLSLQRGT